MTLNVLYFVSRDSPSRDSCPVTRVSCLVSRVPCLVHREGGSMIEAPEAEAEVRGRRGPGRRRDLAAAAACAVVGVALATLPHLAWWPALGEPAWIAEYDDLCVYLATAGQAYHDHPTRLGEPVRVAGGASIYPGLQLTPGILAARALGLGPMRINLLWRAWAGLSIALGWYLVARHHLGRPRLAGLAATLLLADAGLLSGWPLAKHFAFFYRIAVLRDGTLFGDIPVIYPSWRLVTPALSLGYLLLYLWLLARALRRPTRAGAVAAAAAG